MHRVRDWKIRIPSAPVGLGLRCMCPCDMFRRERARFLPGTCSVAAR